MSPEHMIVDLADAGTGRGFASGVPLVEAVGDADELHLVAETLAARGRAVIGGGHGSEPAILLTIAFGEARQHGAARALMVEAMAKIIRESGCRDQHNANSMLYSIGFSPRSVALLGAKAFDKASAPAIEGKPSVAARMAAAMRSLVEVQQSVTEDDLRRAGFTAAEIDAHRAEAIRILKAATPRTRKGRAA